MNTLEDWSSSKMAKVISDIGVAESDRSYADFLTQQTVDGTVGADKNVARVSKKLTSVQILLRT